MLLHEVFAEQMQKWGRCIVTPDMFQAGGYLLSIDQVVSLDASGATLRLSLSFPVTEADVESSLQCREYTDSRGVTHLVNAGGYRCSVQIGLDFPGFDLLVARYNAGYIGNVGVPGPEHLFLVPSAQESGVVFTPVERVNPATGEPVVGLADVVLIRMSIGPLRAVDNRAATEEDVALLREALCAAPAAPATPAAPAAAAATRRIAC